MKYYKLKDIATIYNGNSINKAEKETKYMQDVPGWNYIGTKDVDFDGTVTYRNGVVIPYYETKFRIAPAGSVFVCSEGGSAGRKTAIISEDVCFGNKLFAIVNDRNFFNSKYVYYYTRYNVFTKQFKILATSLMGGISTKNFGTIEIPLPSVDEQARIVARIEEQFSELDNGVQTLQTIKQQLAVYRQAVLTSQYPEMTVENMVSLDSIATIIGGITKGRDLNGADTIELPYLRVANVQNGYLDLSEMKTIKLKVSEKEKYLLKYGDVLYTEGGDRDKLGRGTIWQNEIEDCVHQNHVFKARLDLNRAVPKYVAYWSMSTPARNYFYSKGKQSVNLASINKTILSALPLPLPDMQTQNEIVVHIEERFSVCDSIEKTVDTALAQAEAMRQSILKKAFEGGLA